MARAAQARNALILAWLLVAAWAGVILLLSGEHFSAGATSRFLGPLLGWLVPEDPELRLKLHFWVRKSAHVIEYGIFDRESKRHISTGRSIIAIEANLLTIVDR